MNGTSKFSRRDFLKTSGLVGAAALLPTGRSSAGMMLKHLIPEDEYIPGVANWLYTTCNECPAGCGVQVRLIDGNATKIEGNSQNPINQGGMCARGQAALQGVYSPARVQSPLRRNASGNFDKIDWPSAFQQVAQAAKSAGSSGKVVVVSRQVTGGIRTMMDQLVTGLPNLSLIVHERLEYSSATAANKLCFGIEAIPVYSFDKARTIVSFGADFLETWISPVSYAYGYYLSRGLTNKPVGPVSWFIQFESHASVTGANADERYSVPPGVETLVALATASQMLVDGSLPPQDLKAWRQALKPFNLEQVSEASGVPPDAIKKIAGRLRTGTPSLALAGGPTSRSPYATALQIAVNLINTIARNYGKTISFERTENSPVGTYEQLLGLVEDMEAGRISMLVVHETDLEFDFPDPMRLRNALKKVPLKIQLASVKNDSMESYDMVLPCLYWLEVWDLVEPRTGLECVQQPIINPITQGRHPGQTLADVILAWSGQAGEPAFDYEKFIQSEWEQVRQKAEPSQSFDDFWHTVLTVGGYWLAPAERKVTFRSSAASVIGAAASKISASQQQTLLPITSVRYGEGRQTGMPWLNELPDPITTIVWDNPLLISPATADKWKCHSRDIVRLKCGKANLSVPVFVQAGTNDTVAAMALGAASLDYVMFHANPDGNPMHVLAGDVDENSGSLSWVGTPISFEGVVGRLPLAKQQGSHRQDDRKIAQNVALGEIGTLPERPIELPPASESELYPTYKYPRHKWGMVIDLAACIGCGACVVACQAENNVMVVGKELCLNGRIMHWLRIGRFYDNGRAIFLPMLCQQCGHAPCESVCPVYASVHNSEGLNLQVYNRCVGTRYCANNCPYKVRHFNWFTYTVKPPLDKTFNPDVSVRTRGIMEKCTFCIQRIRTNEENAALENRLVREGEIIPACAQSCPTRAIHFGDMNDPNSQLTKWMKNPRGYRVLEVLNTKSSIVYLRRIYHEDATAVTGLEG